LNQTEKTDADDERIVGPGAPTALKSGSSDAVSASLLRITSMPPRSGPVIGRTMTTRTPARLAYSINEVAELFGISRSSVYNLVERGQLRWINIGGIRRIDAASVHAVADA
jgi:excisionase family DNA binding protein